MDVSIKKFDVAMKVKNKGVELDISNTNGTHLGDLFVTKTRLIWCRGKTTRKRGKKLTWQQFTTYMENL